MPMEVKTQPPTVVVGDYQSLWKRATQERNKPSLAELITFDWTKDEASVNKFIDFIVNLVTYNSIYAEECFKMLVGAFEPYKQAIASGATSIDFQKWEMIAMKVHFFFNKVVSTFPLTSQLLATILATRFPHRIHSVEIHHFYFKNALFVTRYCPTIALNILSSAIDSLIIIDSSISLDEIPDEDDDLQFNIEENQKSEGMQMAHKLDLLMTLMFQYLDACFGVKRLGVENMFVFDGCAASDIKMQDEMFHNLIKAFDQSILPTYKSKYTQYLLFYTCKVYHQKSIFPPLNTNTPLLNQTMNNINTVMATSPPLSNQFLSPFRQPTSPKQFSNNNSNNSNNSKSSYSQSPNSPNSMKPLKYSSSPKSKLFLYIDPIVLGVNPRVQYAESFLRYLFGKLSNERTPTIHRHASAAYIGSFVSRASYLPAHVARLAFKELLAFALQYVDRYDNKDTQPNPSLHSLFYAVAQSVYYIFCFRNTIILDFSGVDDEKQREYWQDLHEALRKLSMSRLNPFKVCLKSVVKQFCAVCLRANIFTKCTSILRANSKIVLAKSVFDSNNNASTSTNTFDSFFPFDPYLLRQSSSYVNNIFVNWKDVMKDDDNDLDDIDSDASDSDDDSDENLKSSESDDSGYSDFDQDDDSDSDDDDSSDDEDASESIEQLTEDFMSFTPDNHVYINRANRNNKKK